MRAHRRDHSESGAPMKLTRRQKAPAEQAGNGKPDERKRNMPPLAEIERELDACDLIEHRNNFERGRWLNYAKAHFADAGKWMEWFEASGRPYDLRSAERYMAMADLAERFGFDTVSNLKVPERVTYDLATTWKNDKGLGAIIAALELASKDKRLSEYDANDLIIEASQCFRFGDYPPATLNALAELLSGEPDDDATTSATEWRKEAVAALKAQKPETNEAAEKIIADVHRAIVGKLFASYGTLRDDIPSDDLQWFESNNLPSNLREKMFSETKAAPVPMPAGKVKEIYWACVGTTKPPSQTEETEHEETEQADAKPKPESKRARQSRKKIKQAKARAKRKAERERAKKEEYAAKRLAERPENERAARNGALRMLLAFARLEAATDKEACRTELNDEAWRPGYDKEDCFSNAYIYDGKVDLTDVEFQQVEQYIGDLRKRLAGEVELRRPEFKPDDTLEPKALPDTSDGNDVDPHMSKAARAALYADPSERQSP
jgi:hypothetical protein